MLTSRISSVLRVVTASLFLVLPAAFQAPDIARAETISVIPPKFELLGNPGDILTEKLRVRNDGSTPNTYITDVEDFTANGDQGGVSFVEDPQAPTTTYSLAKWITVSPAQFSVKASDEQDINITIRIPKTAEPGSHFAAVQVKLSATDQAAPGTAIVESKLNSLILLRVNGNAAESLSIDQFHSGNNFYQKGPVDLVLRTKNTGNVHLFPQGSITITDMFNRKVADVPLTEANVLPGSARQVITSWDSGSAIGKFTATMVATYGDTATKQALTATTTFYIIPIPLIVGIIVLLLVIIIAITQRRKFRKILHRLTSD